MKLIKFFYLNLFYKKLFIVFYKVNLNEKIWLILYLLLIGIGSGKFIKNL